MFETRISSTMLTGDVADAVFPHITGRHWRNDVSFLATLRAFLAPRMAKGDEVKFEVVSPDCSGVLDDLAISADGSIDYNAPNTFRVISVDLSQTITDFLVSEFPKWNPGYERIEQVTMFFRGSFDVLCFINREIKSVVMISDRLNTSRYHYIQIAILPSMPWFFTPGDGVTAEEMNLLRSLKERSSSEYIRCIEEIAKRYDFRSPRIQTLLGGFETACDRAELERAKNEMRVQRERMAEYLERIGEQRKVMDLLNVRILGLTGKVEQDKDSSDMADYFICNKKLYLERVSGSSITFCAADYVTYFDQDTAESIIGNPYSYVHHSYGPYSSNQIVGLMQAIFLDETLKLKLCAAYHIDIGDSVSPAKEYDFPKELAEYMPNPHIDKYGCLGGYESAIARSMADNNYIAAIEQCVASAKSLNWGDSTVMESFLENIARTSAKCIELRDGTEVTVAHAIDLLGLEYMPDDDDDEWEYVDDDAELAF